MSFVDPTTGVMSNRAGGGVSGVNLRPRMAVSVPQMLRPGISAPSNIRLASQVSSVGGVSLPNNVSQPQQFVGISGQQNNFIQQQQQQFQQQQQQFVQGVPVQQQQGNANQQIANASMVYGSMVDIDSWNKKYELLKAQARNGEKRGEVAKHRSPQVKRSIDVLMDFEYLIEDISEPLERVIHSVSSENKVNAEELLTMKNKLEELSSLVGKEKLMNQMASKSDYSWKTVKMFETDSLFSGEDADTLTTRFRAAENKAGRAFSRAKRARFSGNSGRSYNGGGRGRGGYQNVSSNGGADRSENKFKPSFNARDKSQDICFKCDLPGHHRAECPKN